MVGDHTMGVGGGGGPGTCNTHPYIYTANTRKHHCLFRPIKLNSHLLPRWWLWWSGSLHCSGWVGQFDGQIDTASCCIATFCTLLSKLFIKFGYSIVSYVSTMDCLRFVFWTSVSGVHHVQTCSNQTSMWSNYSDSDMTRKGAIPSFQELPGWCNYPIFAEVLIQVRNWWTWVPNIWFWFHAVVVWLRVIPPCSRPLMRWQVDQTVQRCTPGLAMWQTRARPRRCWRCLVFAHLEGMWRLVEDPKWSQVVMSHVDDSCLLPFDLLPIGHHFDSSDDTKHIQVFFFKGL